MIVIDLSVRERLLSGLIPDQETGCLLWSGDTDKNGYGRISINGRKVKVHRVMWEMYEGPIPDGLELDHVKAQGCQHRHCASIAHLEAVTHRENVLRGNTFVAAQAAQTHCRRLNHALDEANTYIDPQGKRHCRKCQRLSEQARGPARIRAQRERRRRKREHR